jgi:O-antigen ligase
VNSLKKDNILFYIAIFCIMAIFLGMLYARALASIALVGFCANGLLVNNVVEKCKQLIKQPWYISWVAVVAMVAISGLWSNNIVQWQQVCWVKLPLVIMPIGFFALAPLSKIKFATISLAIVALITTGTIYSMVLFLKNKAVNIANYQFAKVLPTPFDADHIHFSFCIAICLLLLYKVIFYIRQSWLGIVIMVCATWLVIYLHILAAKTGLLFFYSTLCIIAIHTLFIKSNVKQGLLTLSILITLPVLAWFVSPTFKARMQYIVYDLTQFKNTNYVEGLSDGSRIRSVKAGSQLFMSNWLIGTGYGDVTDHMKAYYNHMKPVPKAYEQIDPSSELVMYAAGCGIVGLIIFLLFMYMPFKEGKVYKDITWYILCLCITIFFLYEIPLEGQFGVSLICFFFLWWRQYYKIK